jgi:hypothetical protein
MPIKKELAKPLEQEVKYVNKGGGREFAYLSGESVISELNRVFGFDGWSYHIRKHELVKSHEDGVFTCTATCDVRLTLHFKDRDITRSGSAASAHIARDPGGLDRACHVAYTDSETTAIKRAARTLGSRFGLDLYDKDEKWKLEYYVAEDTIRETYRWLEEQHPGLAEAIWQRAQRVSGLTNSMVPKASWVAFKEALKDSRKVLDPKKNGNGSSTISRSAKLAQEIRGGSNA